MKQKIKACNILKIVDVSHSYLNKETIELLLKSGDETYHDKVLNEHIYNVNDIFDNYREDVNSDENILSDLECLINLCNSKDAGYIRVIYS